MLAHPNMEHMRTVHPQRITSKFDSIIFDSNFCSGNLSLVTRGLNRNEFNLWVSADGAPYTNECTSKTWFYFSVTGVPYGEQLTFTFKNLSNQSRLYS